MTLEGRLEIYRVAFESAKSELTEIREEFEKLRIRKEHIEKLVTVLRPLLGEGEPTPDPVSAGESTQGQAESAGEVPVEQRTLRTDSWLIRFSVASITCWESARVFAT